MIKYVDGEKLVTMIEEDHLYGFHDILYEYLEKYGVADVKPVVHAHWIVKNCGLYGERRCSNCGGYGNDTRTHDGRTHGDCDGFPISPFNYCPHCGAIMDEEV